MKFKMSARSHVETGVGELFLRLSNEGLFDWFKDKEYGDSRFRIFAVLNCLPPNTNPKQSVRFSKAENTLYLDVMLNFLEFVNADERQRMDFVGEAMVDQIPAVLLRYPKLDFDVDAFSNDLHSWFNEHNWLRKPN